jgi:hypothetical protein
MTQEKCRYCHQPIAQSMLARHQQACAKRSPAQREHVRLMRESWRNKQHHARPKRKATIRQHHLTPHEFVVRYERLMADARRLVEAI